MTVSETYADLGGGIAVDERFELVTLTSTPVAPVQAPGVCVHHRFDPISGWCGCGTRDDGSLAEGSPAWRAARAAS